jgi:hypothetical protein
MVLSIAGGGLFHPAGLPVCPAARIANATNRQALRRCRGALVGSGALEAEFAIPRQQPAQVHGRILAFNGRSGGRPAVLAHLFSRDPPISIVFPWRVEQTRAGRVRTSLKMTVPRSLGVLPRLRSFRLALGRSFSFRGRRRSYLAASCDAPAGFTGGYMSARAKYGFADGRMLQVELVRGCQVRH